MKKILKVLIAILILIFLAAMIFLLKLEKEVTNEIKKHSVDISNANEPSSIAEIIEKYGSEVLETETYRIYVNFCKGLFDENGESNEEYFNNIIKESEKFVMSRFEIVDQEKNILIVLEKKSEEDYKITINEKKDFYEETNGEDYVAAENTKIVDEINLRITSPELQSIVISNMKLNKIQKSLGEKKSSEDGEYDVYKDGAIKIKEYENSKGRIRNMIFSRDYENNIISGINKNYTLEDIENKYPNNSFGSISEGFLGYRTSQVYIYYYKDEVSVYGYSYKFHLDFEKYLERYLEDRNLSNFARNLVVSMDNYYDYEFNEEEQSLYLTYPGRGIEIDIKDNNPKGITLYNNYYFTERTRNFIKDGLISINPDEDYINKIEMERIGKK